MKDYAILQAGSVEKLEEKVNDFIAIGYMPIGGIYGMVFPDPLIDPPPFVLFQAVYRPEEITTPLSSS